MIAAIARLHGAAVATYDVKDFTDCGIVVRNPWDEAA
jgi:predicted nucleic acid-binding protein